MNGSTGNRDRGSRTAPLVVGTLLIVAGIAALVLRNVDVRVPWQAWVVGPGLVLFLAAFTQRPPNGAGLAIAGVVTMTVGALLAVQEATATYPSWAYAWALVAPGGVGLGLLLYGLFVRRGDLVRDGVGALGTGLVLCLVGFAFFEGVLHLDGDRFGDLAPSAVPVVIVALGVLLIIGAFVPGPWRGRPKPPASDWTKSGWTGPAPASNAAPAPNGAPTWAPASTWAPVSNSGWTPPATAAPTPEALDLPLGGATDAEVRISFGAGRLAVGAAQPGKLADGTCAGGVEVMPGSPGRVRLATPRAAWKWNWSTVRPPFEWKVGLTGEVPLRLEVETGAADSDLDLALLRVTDLRIRTGAAQTRVVLPAAAGVTRVSVEGGATQLRFRVPDGVAARIHSSMALGSTDVDQARFPRTPDGRGWVSPGFDSAPHRVDLEIRGGVGQVTVS